MMQSTQNLEGMHLGKVVGKEMNDTQLQQPCPWKHQQNNVEPHGNEVEPEPDAIHSDCVVAIKEANPLLCCNKGEEKSNDIISPQERLFIAVRGGNLNEFLKMVAISSIVPHDDAHDDAHEMKERAKKERELAQLLRARDPEGHTLAHWAAQTVKSIGILNWLLRHRTQYGIPIDEPSNDQVRLHPIHWTCTTGNIQALERFLKEGFDVDTVDDFRRRTPLIVAAQYGHPLMILYLLKNGAQPHWVDIDGDSAFHWAAHHGCIEIAAIFQYVGSKVDVPDHFGQYPLHLAAAQGHLPMVQYLIEELNCLHRGIPDRKGRDPIQLATLAKRWDVEDYLMRVLAKDRWNVFLCWEGKRSSFYFIVANLILVVYVYQSTLIPNLPHASPLFTWHFFLSVVTWSCYALVWRSNPGRLDNNVQLKLEYDEITHLMICHGDEQQLREQNKEDKAKDKDKDKDKVNVEGWRKQDDLSDAVGAVESESRTETLLKRIDSHRPLCHTCHIRRPLRSKHCPICQVCVDELDHHCPFIENCVGKRNYPFFLGFTSFLSVDALMMSFVMYLYNAQVGFSVINTLAMIYYLAIGALLSVFSGFHWYLTAKNLTTNEVANLQRYPHFRNEFNRIVNPFDQGLIQNISSKLCLPSQAYAPVPST